MAKQLCKIQKTLEKDFDAFAELVCDPKFLCVKCGRAANTKKVLCEPKKIRPSSRPFAFDQVA